MPETDRQGWTADRQCRFVAELGRTGCVETASAAVGVHPSSAYRFRARPAGRGLFATAWDAVRHATLRNLEESSLARAIHGDVRPLYSGGKVIGTQVVHPERLAICLLQSLAQSRLGETRPHAAPGHDQAKSNARRTADSDLHASGSNLNRRERGPSPVASRRRRDPTGRLARD